MSTKPVLNAAHAFLAGWSDEQRKRTTFPVDDLEWRKWDNRHFYKRQGVGFDEMDEKQRSLLLTVIVEYVGNMDDGHAKVKMSEVKEHLDRAYFAWIGGTASDSVFYYRIHSPVVLIEFDHERRVAPFRSREPTRDHIHAVVRTPNGNDYGKDLLRQHYERHHHGDHDHANEQK